MLYKSEYRLFQSPFLILKVNLAASLVCREFFLFSLSLSDIRRRLTAIIHQKPVENSLKGRLLIVHILSGCGCRVLDISVLSLGLLWHTLLIIELLVILLVVL